MRFRDLAFLVIANLRRMKLRLALTSLGVVIGTSAIVLMVSLGIGLQDTLTMLLGDFGDATEVQVFPGDPTVAVSMNQETVTVMRTMEHAEAVMPSMDVYNISGLSYKRYETSPYMLGTSMEDLAALGFEVKEGRLPRSDKEMLVGANFGSSFQFKSGSSDGMGAPGPRAPEMDLLGKRLNATVYTMPTEDEYAADPNASGSESTRKFTVVGVLESTGGGYDSMAYITLEAAAEINDLRLRDAEFSRVTVKADSVDSVESVEAELAEMGFATMSVQSEQQALKMVFAVIQGVLGALGGIAMLVAAIGIANTMTMSIFERTREIGIMKAVGASNRQIKRVFLGEAAVIGVLGGLGGLMTSLAGAGLANLFARTMIASRAAQTGREVMEVTFFRVPFWLGVFAIVFAAGVGLLSGVLPAIRAGNLDPLSALRHE